MNNYPAMTRGERPVATLDWKALVAPYQMPTVGRSVWQAVNPLVRYVG